MKFLRFIAPLLLIVNFAFAAFLEARSLDEIKQSGVIRVGLLEYDSSALGWRDKNGTYIDYDVYLAERIAKDLGVRLERVFLKTKRRIPYVREGVVDIMLANFTVTEERARWVDFAQPYMKIALGVISPASAPIKSPTDMEGKRLIVVESTTSQNYLENHPAEDMKVIAFDTYTQAFAALKNGEADGFLCDSTIAVSWTNANPDFVAEITNLGNRDVIAPAVQKGNFSLMAWLNDEIVKLGEENFLLEAYEKTLKRKFGNKMSPQDVIIDEWRVR